MIRTSTMGKTLRRSAICHGDTTSLPQELVDFARRQVINAMMYKGDERRREARHPMLLPVRAVEVNEDNEPIGEPFELVTRDISKNSIGLVHTDEIFAKRLAIKFSIAGTDVFLAADVVWSGPLGPFYGAAGRYIEKLDHFPA